jgi:hypothetical protein
VNEAHPAFVRILSELAPDEALLLFFTWKHFYGPAARVPTGVTGKSRSLVRRSRCMFRRKHRPVYQWCGYPARLEARSLRFGDVDPGEGAGSPRVGVHPV